MNERPDGLSPYPVTTPLVIQWGDQDAFGHVNNTLHFRWFETGRIDYLTRCGVTMNASGTGPILAAISCNYRLQINWPDEIVVGTRVNRIGNTSINVAHAIWSRRHSAVVADGTSTIVIFDYENQKPRPVPANWRAAIEDLEGGPLNE